MLERQQLLIQRPPAEVSRKWVILDPQTGELLGSCQRLPEPWPARILAPLVGRRRLPATVQIREAEDEPLLAILERSWSLLHPRVAVLDADGALVGSVRRRESGLVVLDRQGKAAAVLQGDPRGGNFPIQSPEGEVLCRIESADSESLRVVMTDGLAGNPILKMLLLGAALAVELIDGPVTSSPKMPSICA